MDASHTAACVQLCRGDLVCQPGWHQKAGRCGFDDYVVVTGERLPGPADSGMLWVVPDACVEETGVRPLRRPIRRRADGTVGVVCCAGPPRVLVPSLLNGHFALCLRCVLPTLFREGIIPNLVVCSRRTELVSAGLDLNIVPALELGTAIRRGWRKDGRGWRAGRRNRRW